MSITNVTELETILTGKLRVMTEALDSVTKERDALFIEKSGPYFGHYQQALGEIAILKGKLDYMTANRDEYQREADSMAAAHKVERDELSRLYENTLKREFALQQERDALASKLAQTEARLDRVSVQARQTMVENDKLKEQA